MTRQKSFKARIRARMDKTGESYTAARRQLITDSNESEVDSFASESARSSARRMSDEAVRNGTGRRWDEWFAVLDAWNAPTHSHAEIARWLVEEHGVSAWWAQGLSIYYEQERGIRTAGQQGDGTFAANASKTINAPAPRISEAFTDPELRQQWLPGARIEIRTNRSGKSLTADWDGGVSRISVYLTVQSEIKTRIGLEHQRQPDAETAERMKAHWRSALTRLKSLLEA